MKMIWVLLKNNIKCLTSKSPVFFFMFILLPVVISVGISLLIPSKKNMNGIVCDYSDSQLSGEIIESLYMNACLDLTISDSAKIENEVRLGNYNFGIIINYNFDEAVKNYDFGDAVEVYCNSEGFGKLLEETLSLELHTFAEIINQNNEEYIEDIDEYLNSKDSIYMVNMDDSTNDYTATNMLFSFIIMFAFLRTMTGASLVTKDRELGVYTRILMTDVTVCQYYIANILSSVLVVLFQNVATLCLTVLVTDIEFGGTIGEILVVLSVLSIIAVALGDFFVVCTDNKEISNILSTFVAIILLMTGIVPKELLPKTAVIISSVIPTRWAVNCLENMQSGEPLTGSIIYIVMMLLCAAILFAIIMIIANRKSKNN